MRPQRLIHAALACAVAAAGAWAMVLPARAKDTPSAGGTPNILFLLVDDLGWADVGYQGDKPAIRTPNIDRLAREGMIFTDAYAACPVCSPTRASIVTGKYPARLHLTSHIPSMGKGWEYGRPPNEAEFSVENGVRTRNWLPLEERTIGEALRELSYKTGFFGKWHLGHEPYHPCHQGFDVQAGVTNWGQPPSYYAPYRRPWARARRGYLQIDDLAADAADGEYLTDRLTEEAIRFMRDRRGRRWFCYLSYYTVHTPIQPRQDLGRKHRDKYTAMVTGLDESIGRLMAFLQAEALASNTVVVFMSDNGGCRGNAPLRGNKGSTYEGGIREPMIVRWPGVVRPGSICAAPVISTDFFPTFVGLAGGRSAMSPALDGVSLVPLLKGTGAPPDRALYWHFPHRGAVGTSGAIRRGNYKLIEKFRTGTIELYDLSRDIGEQHNLANDMPDKARELLAELKTWRRENGALMPEK